MKKSAKKKRLTKAGKTVTGERQRESLVEFFARSPLAKAKIKLDRQPDYGRKLSFLDN